MHTGVRAPYPCIDLSPKRSMASFGTMRLAGRFRVLTIWHERAIYRIPGWS